MEHKARHRSFHPGWSLLRSSVAFQLVHLGFSLSLPLSVVPSLSAVSSPSFQFRLLSFSPLLAFGCPCQWNLLVFLIPFRTHATYTHPSTESDTFLYRLDVLVLFLRSILLILFDQKTRMILLMHLLLNSSHFLMPVIVHHQAFWIINQYWFYYCCRFWTWSLHFRC